MAGCSASHKGCVSPHLRHRNVAAGTVAAAAAVAPAAAQQHSGLVLVACFWCKEGVPERGEAGAQSSSTMRSLVRASASFVSAGWRWPRGGRAR